MSYAPEKKQRRFVELVSESIDSNIGNSNEIIDSSSHSLARA